MPYNSKYHSIKGKTRKINSDYIMVGDLKDGWIGVVCDGIGENQEITTTTRLCAEELIKLINQSSESDPIKKLKSAIEKTNEYIYLLQKDKNILSTTIAVLYLVDHKVCWGHAGDSRIYKLKNGRLHRLTHDHSIIQQLIDKGFLTLKEAAFHSGINVVGKAIGEKPKINVDVSKINLQPSDKNRFLICTDGVTEIVSDKEIQEILRTASLEESYSWLISLLETRGNPDDSSFIIVDA